MRQWLDISSEPSFWMLVGFLFLLPFTIAGCYLIFVWLAGLWLVEALRKKRMARLPGWFFCLMLFAFFTLLSTIFSMTPWQSLSDNRELLTLLAVPLCLNILDSERRIVRALSAVLLSSVISALSGLEQAWRNGYSLDARLKGFTSHWMTFSGMLMMALVFFLVAFLLRSRRWPWWVLLPALGVMGVALLLGQTRSAWLGAGAALLFFMLFMRPKAMLALAPLLVVLFLLLPGAVKQRVASIVDPDDPSNRDRICMVYSGWRLFLDHPLTGVGCNAVPLAVAANQGRYLHPLAKKINPHLHNNFLQLLAERGLLALLAFLAFCIVALRELIGRLRAAPGPWRYLPAGALFVFIAFLVAGLFEYNYGDSEVRFYMLFFLSIPFAWRQMNVHGTSAKS
jgi:O-antigen ligase